jgi:hypothetical protein
MSGTDSPPARPSLRDEPSRFLLLKDEVEQEYQPRIREKLQQKIDAIAEESRTRSPVCPQWARPMGYHDTRRMNWLSRWGRVQASVARYRCRC